MDAGFQADCLAPKAYPGRVNATARGSFFSSRAAQFRAGATHRREKTMKTAMTQMSTITTAVRAALLAALFAAASATAADGDRPAQKPQAQKMSACSTQAKDKGLRGDERKSFMSQCLRTKRSQTAMQECAAFAKDKGMRGDDRKGYMRDCLKAKGPAKMQG
jgi:hypothetical protein